MEIRLLIENKVNEAYLRMIFKAKKSGPIKITRNEDVGKAILSRVRYSDLPQKQTIGTTLIIPNSPNEPAKNHYCYFNIEDQDKINDYINADYKLWLKTTMTIATDDLKLSRNETIEYIIDLLKLRNDPTIFENLKKHDYRRRSKIKNHLLKSIQCIHL